VQLSVRTNCLERRCWGENRLPVVLTANTVLIEICHQIRCLVTILDHFPQKFVGCVTILDHFLLALRGLRLPHPGPTQTPKRVQRNARIKFSSGLYHTKQSQAALLLCDAIDVALPVRDHIFQFILYSPLPFARARTAIALEGMPTYASGKLSCLLLLSDPVRASVVEMAKLIVKANSSSTGGRCVSGTSRRKRSNIGATCLLVIKTHRTYHWFAPHHWDSVRLQLSSYTEPFIVESTLHDPFGAGYRRSPATLP
jgi:hypothetical protein